MGDAGDGRVYFLIDRAGGFVLIGTMDELQMLIHMAAVSAGKPAALRDDRLRRSMPWDVRQLPGGPAEAKAIREQFAPLKVDALMYRLEPEMVAFLAGETEGWDGEHPRELRASRPRPVQDAQIPTSNGLASRLARRRR